MEAFIVAYYFGLALIVAYQGQFRNVGVMKAFAISILFSPVAGAFVVATSKFKD